MIKKITFEDKEQINQITEYPEKNQCTADNLNEIKNVVNSNADETNQQDESINANTTDIIKLQEENAKLKAQIPTGTAAGAEISLNDSAEMELVDFGLQGNSYQEVNEGKNKAIIPDREETFNGMSINIKNGIINITGKSSVTYTSYRIVGSAELEAGKTYYLRLFGNKDGSASLRNDTESVWFPDSENNENQFTPTVGGTYNIQLGFGSGENQNWNVRYSISETSNADWVEGKEPKPTLENPSEVEAVGDNINIFDDTVEKVMSTINDSGNEVADTGTNDFYKQIIIPTSKNYIMHFDKINGGSTASYVRFAYYNDETFLSREISNTNNYIFTVPENCNKIDCKTNAGTNNGINFENLKIEKGAVATTYSPCLQGSTQIIKSNKNILDFGNQIGNGIAFNKNRITLNNPTGYLYSTNNNIGGNKFLSGKTLIFSLKANGEITGNNMAQFIVHSNKRQYLVSVNYPKKSYANTINTVKVTLADDERIGSVQVWTVGTTCDLTIDVQIEISDEATDFIEHEGNTYTIPVQKPFYKIGDYADTFIKQDNKCYEQHYIKEYIFTGNENWFDGGTTTNNQYIWSNPFEDANKSILGNYNDDIVSPVLSNYFISIGNRSNNAGSVGISFVNFTNGETHLRVGVGLNSEYNTLELFKQKLQELNAAGTPVKMYYISSTPELIKCISEQTQILEQIIKDGTYKEVTHFYTTEDLKPTMQVKYYKDLETLFNKQAELESTLNNVQAQLLELGGN